MRSLQIPILFAMAAVATQLNAEMKMLSFRHSESARNMEELGHAIRIVAIPDELKINGGERTMTLNASRAAIEIAEWMLMEWDQPVSNPPLDEQGQDLVIHEHRVNGALDEFVRIYYFTHNQSWLDLSQATELMSAISEIRSLVTYGQQKAIAFRGSRSQIELSDWLMLQLNRPEDSKPPLSNEFKPSPGNDDLVRIFYLPEMGGTKKLLDSALSTRSSTNLHLFFPYKVHRAIVVRGTAEQMAQAEELLRAAK